jgi:putative sugar O-methyltransferase
VAQSDITQAADRPDLLRLLLEDASKAPGLFQPTNYWAGFKAKALAELEQCGLTDFRRRSGSVLSGFGATDTRAEHVIDMTDIKVRNKSLLANRYTQRIPGWLAVQKGLNQALSRTVQVLPGCMEYLRQSKYATTKREGERSGARSLDQYESSLVGNPEDVLEVNGRSYTTLSLYYYLSYAYCSRFVDFERLNTIVELGPGAGKQVEVIRKLHPRICFFLFDLPVQTYVCEQYLRSVFPEAVVGYEETRDLTETPSPEPGKLFIFGNWQFPILKSGAKIDLFWNAASFQEMEPDIVANYLSYVDPRTEHAYLRETMDGKELHADLGREGGVIEKTTLRHYREGLPSLELLDVSFAKEPKAELLPLLSRWNKKPMRHVPMDARGFCDSFWRRCTDKSN